MARKIKYIGFIPENLKIELIFMDILDKSKLITSDQHNSMIMRLKSEGYMDQDHEICVTGDDFFFSIRGDDTINNFTENMRKFLPGVEYVISDEPVGKTTER